MVSPEHDFLTIWAYRGASYHNFILLDPDKVNEAGVKEAFELSKENLPNYIEKNFAFFHDVFYSGNSGIISTLPPELRPTQEEPHFNADRYRSYLTKTLIMRQMQLQRQFQVAPQPVEFDYKFKIGNINTNEEFDRDRLDKFDIPTIEIDIPGLNWAENQPYTVSIHPNSTMKTGSLSIPDHRENYDQLSDSNFVPYYKIGLFSKYLPNFFNTGTNFYEQNNYQSKIDEASLQISETRYDAFCVKGEAVLKMYTEFEGTPQGGEPNSYKTQNISLTSYGILLLFTKK